ncbi:MAG: hypothetical protein QM530_10065 [Phycisphaerales bacterium]|nr:hypothetical protein [Phycisphaerales bacterium]
MKKSMFTVAVVAIAISGTAVGCANNNEKVADAKQEVVEAKDDLVKAQDHAAQSAAKAASVEEWKLFKIESETKIHNNEGEIERLKIILKKPGKTLDPMYGEKIAALEKMNKDLKSKVNDYKTSQSDWATFKREYDYDMESLTKAIKDIGSNNRK